MAQKQKSRFSVTVTWPLPMIQFVQGKVYDEKKIKISQLTEIAMEQWLKENGYWNEYQATLAGDIL